MAKIAVIGAGFSGISAACYLAQAGHKVHVYEKNATAGGRARQLKTDSGYVFDMGPSWYWMPDVFRNFFGHFNHRVEDLYQLQLLNPSFDVVYPQQETLHVPADYNQLKAMFEAIEPGAGKQLDAFMQDARLKYEIGMEQLVHKPGLSLMEFMDTHVIREALRLKVFSSFSKHVRRHFRHPKLIALMEFPVLFLGATPQNTPALYSLMNYAGLQLGTWYPQGGFGKVIDAMVTLAESMGVIFHYNSEVQAIDATGSKVHSLKVNGQQQTVDAIVAAADYHHVESKLLPTRYRNYGEAYWNKRTFAPSSLIFYIGLSKRLPALAHHTLFFDEALDQHAQEIYKNPQWPTKPLFYVCCPSQTDDTVAPPGHENLFILMPIAPGLEDTEALREQYFQLIIKRLEEQVQEPVAAFIDYRKSYCVNDFINDYHSYKGNAYGLANTLRQTANLKPKLRNRQLRNLLYAGQLTVPGPGVPPSLISGKLAANELIRQLKKTNHEAVI